MRERSPVQCCVKYARKRLVASVYCVLLRSLLAA
jgi:hypothetical protein